MEFILTLDTEGDNQWDHGRALSVENIKYVPRFQELCNKYKIKPTYLVTSEVCNDVFAKKLFKDYQSHGLAEIGAHLHSWTTPPFLDRKGFRHNDSIHPFASELPEDILNEKIRYITDQIETSFGQRPFSFRSGRFGFNDKVARVLIQNSYIVDSSITPYTNWSDNRGLADDKGGPDFSEKQPFPFEYIMSGSSTLIEIPVTIIPTVFLLKGNNKLTRYYFRNVDRKMPLRQVKKYFFPNQPLWLRPFDWTVADHFRQLIDEANRIELPYFVMMFHSSELMPGCSIYRKDNDSIERLYNQLETFFLLLEAENIFSCTLTEAGKKFKLSAASEKKQL